MPRYSDDPVRHTVTFRVNLEEKEFLEKMAKLSGRTVSDFVRNHLVRKSIAVSEKTLAS